MTEANQSAAPATVPAPNPIPPSYERLPGETPKAYGTFQIFLRLGSDRSIRKAARTAHKTVTTLADWSVKNHWMERAAAYDAAMSAKEQAAIEAEQKRRAKVWADRRDAHRERRFQIGKMMLDKAERILKGRGKFTQHTASRLAQVGDQLIGLAADLPTSNTTISAPDGGAVITAPAGTVNVYLPEKEKLPDEPPAAASPTETKQGN